MDKFVKSKNFIFKYLILELFEKLYRLEKYIKTCEKFDRKNNNDKIIKLFHNSIEIIGQEINLLCADINNELSDNVKFGYILTISQNSKAIVKIHEELKNLHSSWILPEIKTFTNEIINGTGELKNEINIILSDNYSFLESNLGKKFETSLREVYLNPSNVYSISENHSFILPKIEFSNPLNWTIIVHEAGHLQNVLINKIRENPEIMPDKIETINKSKIKNWAEEIFCDIYATSLLGPAYFISFVSFALLSTMDYGISSDSEIHPSVIIRASIMINYLRDNNLVFEDKWGVQDYTQVFYESLLEQHDIFKDETKVAIDGITKFNRNLRRHIKKLQLNKFSIKEADAERINRLINNLQKGVPIGSISEQNGLDIEEMLKKASLSKSELDQLKAGASERNCKIWEILNAGWVYKLENSCLNGESIFFSDSGQSDMSIIDKIDKYGEVVDFLDDRLLSSINTSQILKIIENS